MDANDVATSIQILGVFSLCEHSKYWNPYFIGDIMSCNHFEEINQHFTLRIDDPPSNYRDKFWWIKELIVEWNTNMIDKFSPSWIVYVCRTSGMVDSK